MSCIDYFDSDDSKCNEPGRVKLSEENCEGNCDDSICCPSTCNEWQKGNLETRSCDEGKVLNKSHECSNNNPCAEEICCIEKEDSNLSYTFTVIIFLIFGIISVILTIYTGTEFNKNGISDKLKEYGVYIVILLFIMIYLGIQSGKSDGMELSPRNPSFLRNLLVIPIIGILFLNACSIGGVNISIFKKISLTKDELSTQKTAIILGILFLLITIGEVYSVIKGIIDESKPDETKPDEGETTDIMKNINNYFIKNGIDEWVNILYVFIILILCIFIKNKNLNNPIKGILVILLILITSFKIISSINTSSEEHFNFISIFISSILTALIAVSALTKYGKDIDLNKFIIPLLIFEIIVFIVYRNFYNVFNVKEENNEDLESREISVIKVVYLSLIVTIILKSIKELDKYLDSKRTILFFIILTIFLLSITSNKWYERKESDDKENDNCTYENSLINYNNNKQIEIDLELRKNVYIDDNVLFFIIITIIFVLILKDGDNIKDVGIFIIFIISYSLIYFIGYLIKDEKITNFDMSTDTKKTTCNEGIDSDCKSSVSTIYKRNKRGLLKCGSLSVTDYYIRRIAGISIKDIRNFQNTEYSSFQTVKFLIRLVIFFGIIYLIYKPVKKKFEKSYIIFIMVSVILMIILPLFSKLLLSDSPFNDNPGPAEYIDNNIKNNVYYETIRDYMSYVFKNPLSRVLSKRDSVYKDDDTMITGIDTDIRNGSEEKNKTKPNFMNDYGGLIILLIMIIILVIKIVFK